MVAQVATTALFYALLKPVSGRVALVYAFIELTGCVIKLAARGLYIAPLFVLRMPPAADGFSTEQLHSLALILLKEDEELTAEVLEAAVRALRRIHLRRRQEEVQQELKKPGLAADKELLRELLPGATRIAVLVNPNNPGVTQNVIQHTQVAARRLGLEIVVVEAATEREIESSIAIAVRQQAEALSIGNDAYLSSRSRLIAFLALRHALPTMAFTREFVAAGILMSYGSSQTDSFRLAGVYVGRILKGDMPANFPVIQPTKFELFINLTTATALGLKISDNLLSLADEVIE